MNVSLLTYFFYGLGFSFPEPLGLLLVGVALILVPLIIRRRRKQISATPKKNLDAITVQPTETAE